MEKLITPDFVTEVCGYIRVGVSFKVALLATGIREENINEILSLANTEKKDVWKEFSHDIKKAFAQFEVMQIMKINAEGGARGSQWLLERGINKEFMKKNKRDKKKEIEKW